MSLWIFAYLLGYVLFVLLRFYSLLKLYNEITIGDILLYALFGLIGWWGFVIAYFCEYIGDIWHLPAYRRKEE